MQQESDRRVVKTSAGASIVISSMIGTGIFTTTGLMAEMGAKGGDIIIAWLLGGLLALCGALCYGELGANMPDSGGEYLYISRILHPSLGFLSGWVSLIAGFSGPLAAASIAMHIYMQEVIPEWPVRPLAAGTIILFSLLHSYDLRLGVKVQTGLVVLKVALIVLFIGGSLFYGPSLSISNSFKITPDLWFSSTFATILIFVAFSYFGWNAATYIGAEIKDPGANLPKSLIYGTVIVTVLYLLINIAYINSIQIDELKGIESVAGTVGDNLWGNTGGKFVSVLISIGLIATISSLTITGPRVYEAMAKDKYLPYSISKLNSHGVPSRAVALQAIVALLFTVTATFKLLLVYIGFTLNIFAACTVISVIYARRKGVAPIKVCLGYPFTPLIFLIFTIWMTVWSIRSEPLAAMVGLGTLAVGYFIYLIQARNTGINKKR